MSWEKGGMDILETPCQKDCKANSLVTTRVGARARTDTHTSVQYGGPSKG